MPIVKASGKYAVTVDDVDFRKTAEYRWSITNGYAIRAVPRDGGGQLSIYMHRYILEKKLGRTLSTYEITDHINGNRLDNRRENLRVASHATNARNKSLDKRNKLGLKGVEFLPYNAGRPYKSRISLDGKTFWIGSYPTPDEAAWMYDQWALVLFGEFARTNFEYGNLPIPVELGVPLLHKRTEVPHA